MTAEISHALWRKSSHSGSGQECVEAALNLPEVVAVRDSKDPAGPALTVSHAQWRAFTARLKGAPRLG